jgi:hypothetical protein
MAATQHMTHGPTSTHERRKQFQKLKQQQQETSGFGYVAVPPSRVSSPQVTANAANHMDAGTYHAMASNNHSTGHLI